jgi:PAS domain S-box-containing protein
MEEVVDDVVRAPNWAVPYTSPVGRAAALSAGYVALYLTLDRLTFIGALHGVGITPWNPTTGLALALLIVKGLRYAPLVMAADLLSNATLPTVPVSLVTVCLGSLVMTVCYAAAATLLRRASLQAGICNGSDAVAFLIVTVGSSGLAAGGFVAIYAVAGIVPWPDAAEAVYHYWIGDAIGIVVFVPPLLLLRARVGQPLPADYRSTAAQLIELAAQSASVVAALVAVFAITGGDHPLGHFYLLFMPLIWIAMRRGLPATCWAVMAIQLGLIAGIEVQGHSELTLRMFQLLMFSLAATGLVLGAVVSERWRLSSALVESEGRRRAVLNTARDGVLTIDAGGRIQSINPAVERLFARPSDQLIGHGVAELVEDAPNLLHRLKLAAGSPVSKAACWELDARRADGGTFPIELTAGHFDLPGGEHYTLVIRDITARRKAEARYRQHQAELAHVSRVSLAGEMAAGLAHELSQPLTAITAYGRGCVRLLAEAMPEPAILREGLAELVQQAERAGDVLDRLREFVRGGESRRSLTRIKPLIDAALGLARVEATQFGVAIDARIDPGLPPVLADRVQIEQVVLNLLRNAMEAIEGADPARRSIVVKARRTNQSAVEISVVDTGPGVQAEVTDTLFEPFVTTKPCGMGMGLSISRSIVEAHGGRLRMARNLPNGAVFLFDLPTTEAAAAADAG